MKLKRDKLIKLYVDSDTYDLLLSLSKEFNHSLSGYVFLIVRSFLRNVVSDDERSVI